MSGRRKAPSPADALRQFIYGDAPLDEWVLEGADSPGEPWSSFQRAERLARAGQPDEAAKIWQQIALAERLGSRQTLQAWHFLRQAGYPPPPDRAQGALGVVAEMPVHSAHDLLAAYHDGTARYLNYSGKVVIWEDPGVAEIRSAIDDWLATGQVIANAIGPWERSALPPLPVGHVRVMTLTPAGPRFGQGPAAGLSEDPIAGSFLTAATKLMQLILSRAMT
jgi:hypothetical protein